MVFSCDYRKIEMKYSSGSLMIIGKVDQLGKIGDWVFFEDNGDTLRVESYKNSELLKSRHYKNGILTSENSFLNGFLVERVIFKSTHNIVFYYSDEDILRSKSFQKDKKPFGRYIQYHKNGAMEIFTEDVKNGVFSYFDSLGNPTYDIKVQNYGHVDTLKIW